MIAVPQWLLQNAVIATLAAALLALALCWWKPSARVEHLLWLAILIKFILPPIAVFPVPAAFSSIFVEGVPHAEVATPAIAPPAPAPAATTPRVAPPGPAPRAPAVGYTPAGSGAGIVKVLLLIWLAGAVTVAAVRAWKHLRWRRNLKAYPAPPHLQSIVRQLSGELGTRSPLVQISSGISSPLVLGLLRPGLLWPQALIEHLTPDKVRTVVLHELAHVSRGDLWVGLIDQAVTTTWWWYPGARLVSRGLRDAAERACDARVVELLPGNRRTYAEALLDVLESQSAAFRQPSLALGLDGPGSVERRLRHIMDGATKTSVHAAGLALVMAGATLLTAWTVSPVEPRIPDADGYFSGVVSRGEVELGENELPALGERSWFIAFTRGGGSPSRSLELVRLNDDETIIRYLVNGQNRPVDGGTTEWLADVIQESQYEREEVKASTSSSGAFVPSGPHVHLTGREDMVALWSGAPASLDRSGKLGPHVDVEHPVVMVHQGQRTDPLHFMVLTGDSGLRAMQYSVNGGPAEFDYEANQLASRLLSQISARVFE